jgi:hypothetical protein
MKTSSLLFSILFILSISACSLFENDELSIDGEQSTMGEPGAEVYCYATLAGVDSASATVIDLEDGVSSFTGKAIITDPKILNVISNIPEFTVEGDKVTVSDLKFKVTKEGVESMNDDYPGIIVKYDSKVGDKYPVKNGIEREVIYKSTEDDYGFGWFLIKVIKVEESPSLIPGVSKVIYISNHKFGIVGVEVTYEDNTTQSFGITGSTEN